MNLLESMQVYVLIVDKGSLSAAAAALAISPTMPASTCVRWRRGWACSCSVVPPGAST